MILVILEMVKVWDMDLVMILVLGEVMVIEGQMTMAMAGQMKEVHNMVVSKIVNLVLALGPILIVMVMDMA